MKEGSTLILSLSRCGELDNSIRKRMRMEALPNARSSPLPWGEGQGEGDRSYNQSSLGRCSNSVLRGV